MVEASEAAESGEESKSDSSGTDIRAVSRVAQILALFSPTRPSVTSTTVATQLGMNRTTAYRYCMSLMAAELLERTDNGEFTPGKILMQLGAFAIGRREILRVAPPHMRALATATRATAVLSLWGTTGPVVSAVADDTQRDVLVTVRVGTHLHMNTAQAKIFYAYHPDQLYIGQLLANLPQPEHQQVLSDITDIRRNGYATAVNKRGIAIIAAPIFDGQGLSAALAVLSTRDVLSTHADAVEVNALVSTAHDITKEMGGTTPRD